MQRCQDANSEIECGGKKNDDCLNDRELYYTLHLSSAKSNWPTRRLSTALNQRRAIKAERLINLASSVRILMSETRARELSRPVINFGFKYGALGARKRDEKLQNEFERKWNRGASAEGVTDQFCRKRFCDSSWCYDDGTLTFP